MSKQPLLSVENLCAWLGAAQILFEVSLGVAQGEVVALMCRNGAGKSTTLKAIMGLIGSRAGRICFCGREISQLEPFEIARLGLGFTPQDRRIFADLTVLENLDVGRQPPRRFGDGRPAPTFTPQRLFALFPNLAERSHALGRQMSGGEQQMLSVARTLMGNPLLLLLDEPSEGMAPIIVEQMANTLIELKRKGYRCCLPSRTSALPISSATASTFWKKAASAGAEPWRRSPPTGTPSAAL